MPYNPFYDPELVLANRQTDIEPGRVSVCPFVADTSGSF